MKKLICLASLLFSGFLISSDRQRLVKVSDVHVAHFWLYHGFMYDVKIHNAASSKQKGYVLIEEQSCTVPHGSTFYLEKFTGAITKDRKPVDGKTYYNVAEALRELDILVADLNLS